MYDWTGHGDKYAKSSHVKGIPKNRHITGKDLTFPIKQTNSDIRHWPTLKEKQKHRQEVLIWLRVLLSSFISFKIIQKKFLSMWSHYYRYFLKCFKFFLQMIVKYYIL